MTKKKGRYMFIIKIVRTLDYDMDDKVMMNAYGNPDFIEDMVEIDRQSANDDPMMFFIDSDCDWKEVTVKKLSMK